MVAVTRYIAVFFALLLAFTFIPYLNRKQNYELYVIRLAVSFFVTYLFSVILFAGLSAMLATIGYLFEINILGAFYFDIWAIVAGIFAPAFSWRIYRMATGSWNMKAIRQQLNHY